MDTLITPFLNGQQFTQYEKAKFKWGFILDYHLSNTIEYCFILKQKYYTSAELMIEKILSTSDNYQYKNLLYQLIDHIIDQPKKLGAFSKFLSDGNIDKIQKVKFSE